MTWEDGDTISLGGEDYVSHVIGSSGQKDNWKRFWCKHTERNWPRTCNVQGCSSDAEVGAHMWIKRGMNINHQTFIVPTCQTCNKDGIHDFPNWVSVNEGTVAVRIVQHEGVYES